MADDAAKESLQGLEANKNPVEAAEVKVVRKGKDKGSVDKDGRPQMHVLVHSPFHVYFDDQAYSLSGEDATGPFDILPRHHNFIAILQACELTIRGVNDEVRLKISGGLMHVKADELTIFLNI
jgi:hypothetical protein